VSKVWSFDGHLDTRRESGIGWSRSIEVRVTDIGAILVDDASLHLGGSLMQPFSAADGNWTAMSQPFGSSLLLRKVAAISQSMYNCQTGASMSS
jgi:hypothetical protein